MLKRLWYFLTFRFGKAFGSNQMGLLRECAVSVRRDPFQGKGDKVFELIQEFFPSAEHEKAYISLRRNDHMMFDTKESAEEFFSRLDRLGLKHSIEFHMEDTYMFIPDLDWYEQAEYTYLCPDHGLVNTCRPDGFDDEQLLCNKRGCGLPVRRIIDLKQKEVTKLAREIEEEFGEVSAEFEEAA